MQVDWLSCGDVSWAVRGVSDSHRMQTESKKGPFRFMEDFVSWPGQ